MIILHSSDDEHRQWLEPVAAAMTELAEKGAFSLPRLQLMRSHLDDYRSNAGRQAP